MENRGEYGSAARAETMKAWATFFDALSRRMSDDYWAHADALGRYFDELVRARSFATFDEARRAYRQRALTVLEQSAQGYASLFERPSVVQEADTEAVAAEKARPPAKRQHVRKARADATTKSAAPSQDAASKPRKRTRKASRQGDDSAT